MYVLLNYAQNSLCGGKKYVGPFLAWRLIVYMMLVRLGTVPLAIQHLKLTLMDLQGAMGTLRLIKKGMYFSILEWRSYTEQYGADSW